MASRSQIEEVKEGKFSKFDFIIPKVNFFGKITNLHNCLHNRIWLYEYYFWGFSTIHSHVGSGGKNVKHQKIALVGLCKRLCKICHQTLFLTYWRFLHGDPKNDVANICCKSLIENNFIIYMRTVYHNEYYQAAPTPNWASVLIFMVREGFFPRLS